MFKLNVFICIVVLLSFGCMYKVAYAANDLERWNSEVGRTVRQSHSDKLAQTTYSEISSKNVTVSQDMKTVYPQIETSSQVAGSRTRVVAEATLVADKDKVWRDWNKKLNKWGPKLGGAAVVVEIGGRIMDAVDWVMDPKNNTITKKEESATCDPYHQYCYSLVYTESKSGSISSTIANYKKQAVKNGTYTSAEVTLNGSVPSGAGSIAVTIKLYKDGDLAFTTTAQKINKNLNRAYNSTAQPPERTVVSEEEKERVLKDLLNDPKYADLARDMIGNTYSMGPENPEPDPNVVNDLKNKQKDVLKSDNPKGDGKTRTDPKIDTGTQGQADTTPKPDTGTGTNPDPGTTPNPNPNTGSTTNFELPAFCNYAAIVCDWIGWTKEEPELVDEKLQIQERDVTDYKYEDHIKFGQSCPFSEKTENLDLGVGVMKVKYNLDFFCDFSREAKPTIVGIGHLGALIFLLIGIRSGASG